MLLENIWIIVAIPVASFLFLLLAGRRLLGAKEKLVSGVGIAAIGSAFVLSCIAGVQWLNQDTYTIPAPAKTEVKGKVLAAEDAEAVVTSEEAVTTGSEAGHSESHGGVLATDVGGCIDVVPGHSESKAEGEAALGGSGPRSVPLVRAAEGGEEKIIVPVQCQTTWFEVGDTVIHAGTYVDGMTIALLFVVTLISLLVHVFASEYLHGDKRYVYFFAALSLFTAGMLIMITASNTLQLIFGWELMGVCSFMLIGHWWEKEENSRAALKAFFTTRTGDIGLLVGLAILFWLASEATGTPTFNINVINTLAFEGALPKTALLVAASFLLLAVVGKSAQFPLHTWLPDAMAGPTPVSALIHAATMVVAGVYLVARLFPVFWQAFDIGDGGSTPIAIIGLTTAIVASLLAFVQNDIKKVLAYSTVSQLGLMILALGVGAWTAALFHLFTHAFFKACLFLGAGSLSHACHHSFDMKKEMGGLWRKMPITFATFSISTLSLMAVFPLAGFWSKDEILVGANTYGYPIFAYGVYVSAFLTAAYMGRCMWLVFFGTYRGHSHPHESPIRLTLPLVVLSVFAVFAGFANAFFFDHPFDKMTATFLNLEAYAQAGLPSVLEFSAAKAVNSTVVVLVALAVVYAYFAKGLGPHGFSQRNKVAGAGITFLEQRLYLDHLWGGVPGAGGVVGGLTGPVGRATVWTNKNLLDGVVNGSAVVTLVLARFSYNILDRKVVDGAVNGSGLTAGTAGSVLRRLQSGQVQTYAAWLFGAAGVFALALVLAS